jgi:hypothetical protein
LRVRRGDRDFTVDVAADGDGLVSHAGSALLAEVADRLGFTTCLSVALERMRVRRSRHDPAIVIRDLAVMLADGGDCLSDLAAVRDQEALFGEVASDSTAFRVIDRVGYDGELLDALRRAHASARDRAWQLGLRPELVTCDLDATLIESHSDKDGAAGNYKGGYGFAPMLCYADETGEALAGVLRPGNAGANNPGDQIECLELALVQIPAGCAEAIDMLVRCDSAGHNHRLVDFCREHDIRFSVGSELSEPIRDAILTLDDAAWRAALRQDGEPRDGAQVAEISALVSLDGWPEGSRLIVRRERPHPGAQLSFTDHDGHRFQVILTDQTDPDIAVLERRHRARANVEDHIRCDKDTGLRKLPFRQFRHNEVWLELVLIAHNLIAWTKQLLLSGELAKSEPKRLRYRLLHVAARLAFHANRAKLRLQANWPWAHELVAAFDRLEALAPG